MGGIKGSLTPHGAEQIDENTPHGRKQTSAFFNYFVFSLSCGTLIAVTLVVWVEDNMGWQWGFGISTLSIFLSIPIFLSGSTFYRNKVPLGSPLTTICKVLVASILNSCLPRSSSNAIVIMATIPYPTPDDSEETSKQKGTAAKPSKFPSESLTFLNQSLVSNSAFTMLNCSVQQLEEVKIVIKILPIFACTIMLNCCLAQLSTFSVQQAATMDTKLGSLKVPPASLPVLPVLFIMILVPLYNHAIIPLAHRATISETGITHLQRIGIGLVLSIIAMAVAALVETKRKRVAAESGLLNSATTLPMTFFWIALQYLFVGSADLFTLARLLELFFTEAPLSMRSLATSLTWASLATRYYLSTVIVYIINITTGNSKQHHQPWLSGGNLNHFHLEKFYWLMCGVSGLNLLHYLFWATNYRYQSGAGSR